LAGYEGDKTKKKKEIDPASPTTPPDILQLHQEAREKHIEFWKDHNAENWNYVPEGE